MPENKPVNTDDDDITDEELKKIQDQVDAEIEKNGLPTEEDLMKEIERMNTTQ